MSPAQVHVTGKYKIWNYSPTLQTPSPVIFLLLIFFFALLGFELRAYALSHSTSPFFVIVFFKIGFHNLFACLGWLQTAVLLISTSLVVGIIHISHHTQPPVPSFLQIFPLTFQ
jgi:hypothetical protein